MTVSPHEEDLVSVIVPAYNAGKYVRETLASVLAQTYRTLEVVVVDDGSSDDTARIVEAVMASDPRVRLIRQQNKGVAAARNAGIAAARGAFIAPVDADDLWHPSKIAKQLSRMRAGGQQVGLVYVWSASIDENGRVLHRRFGETVEGDAYAALILYNFLGNGSTPLFRRSCLERTGLYDERFRNAADFLFYLAMAERYDFAVVPEFLVGYRQVATSLSRNLVGLIGFHEQVLADARRRHPELPERLFRWSMAAACFPAAGKSLRNRQFKQGMALLAKSILLDPGLVLTPMMWQRSRHEPGPRFLDLPPEPTGSVAPASFDRRRINYAASLRIKRPSD